MEKDNTNKKYFRKYYFKEVDVCYLFFKYETYYPLEKKFHDKIHNFIKFSMLNNISIWLTTPNAFLNWIGIFFLNKNIWIIEICGYANTSNIDVMQQFYQNNIIFKIVTTPDFSWSKLHDDFSIFFRKKRN